MNHIPTLIVSVICILFWAIMISTASSMDCSKSKEENDQISTGVVAVSVFLLIGILTIFGFSIRNMSIGKGKIFY